MGMSTTVSSSWRTTSRSSPVKRPRSVNSTSQSSHSDRSVSVERCQPVFLTGDRPPKKLWWRHEVGLELWGKESPGELVDAAHFAGHRQVVMLGIFCVQDFVAVFPQCAGNVPKPNNDLTEPSPPCSSGAFGLAVFLLPGTPLF